MNIAVFGSSRPREGEAAYADAREIGREIARQGAAVLCGGYGGVMEAACRGASDRGGESIGVVLEGAGSPNPWLTRRIVEPDLAGRLTRLRDEADAWIFLPHGLGTMLELVWIAESVVKGWTPPRPFVLFGGFWREIRDRAIEEASSTEGARALRECLRESADAAEAVRLARGAPAESPVR